MANISRLQRLGIADAVDRLSLAPNDFRSVLKAVTIVEPDEIYNLSGQTSVGLSFDQPVECMESIAAGTLNLLEVIRYLDRPVRFFNAGSSECFGDTGMLPADERTPFRLWLVCLYRDHGQSRITAEAAKIRDSEDHSGCQSHCCWK
jgi:GDPmannose 4,6-dehydratase